MSRQLPVQFLAVAAMLAACQTTPAPAPAPVQAGGLIGGDYSTVFGAPTTVHITSSSSGGYAVTAKTAIAPTGAMCSIPAGTTLATFSGKAPTFTGQGPRFSATCAQVNTVNLKVTLNADGSLTVRLETGETYVLTKL